MFLCSCRYFLRAISRQGSDYYNNLNAVFLLFKQLFFGKQTRITPKHRNAKNKTLEAKKIRNLSLRMERKKKKTQADRYQQIFIKKSINLYFSCVSPNFFFPAAQKSFCTPSNNLHCISEQINMFNTFFLQIFGRLILIVFVFLLLQSIIIKTIY